MKIQSLVKKIAGILGLGVVASLFSVSSLQLLYYNYDFEKAFAFLSNQTTLSLLQVGIVFIVFMWLYFLTTSVGITSLLLLVLSVFIGIATQQKLVYRGEPVYPSDIHFLKDFRFLLEMVDFKIVALFFLIMAILVIGVIAYIKKHEKKFISWQLKLFRFTGLVLSTICLFYASQFNQPGNKIKALFNNHTSWIAYSQEKNYGENGVISGLMYNLKSPAVVRPDNYSEKTITELYEKYSQIADSINAKREGSLEDYNIIFIMNETFSDPMRIEGITISSDPLSAFRNQLVENKSGMSLSQGYGGGTANIEFEALTGVSLEPLASNVTTPFIQLSNQMQQLPTIVDFMEMTDHALTALHPYNSSMYKRIENYQALGFESTLFEDDMQYTQRIDDNTFISDYSAYLEVLDVMAESEKKDFVHLVTMNNHKPHVNKYENVEFDVEGAPYNLEVAHYSKGLQHSSQDLQLFLEKIEKLEEKTIVVFWGDHLPSFYGEEIFKMNGHVRMHETPLLFYTNFSKDSRDIGTISPMYFINHVLEIADAPVTPYVALLEKLEEVLPAFEKGIYLERETALKYNRDDLKPSTQLALLEYDFILYDITTGKNYSKNIGLY